MEWHWIERKPSGFVGFMGGNLSNGTRCWIEVKSRSGSGSHLQVVVEAEIQSDHKERQGLFVYLDFTFNGNTSNSAREILAAMRRLWGSCTRSAANFFYFFFFFMNRPQLVGCFGSRALVHLHKTAFCLLFARIKRVESASLKLSAVPGSAW